MKNKTLEEIQQQHVLGQLKQAKEGYLAFIDAYPKNAQALHGLGMLCLEEKDLTQAIFYLEAAILLEQSNPDMLLHLANVYKLCGRYNDAETILEALIESFSGQASPVNNLGTLYFMQERWDEAIHAFKVALEIDSRYVDAYFNLALTYKKAHRFEESLTAFSALLALVPDYFAAVFQMGSIRMELQQYEDAIKCFETVLQQIAAHVESRINLATCYLKLGNMDEAFVQYTLVLKHAPDDDQVLFNLGVLLAQQENVIEAVHFYEEAVKINPALFEAWYNLGFIAMSCNQKKEAKTHFEKALLLHPEDEALQHTLDILSQTTGVSASPLAYVKSLFDSYADHYDAHLLNMLQYRVPQLIQTMIAPYWKKNKEPWCILDMGCGTGLCGEYLKPMAHTLTGVDVSPNMLTVATLKKIYDALIEADLLVYLQEESEVYDLVVAADVLVYGGDLNPWFARVKQALKPGGLFIFNIELSNSDNFYLKPTGRFAHQPSYVCELAASEGLILLKQKKAVMRLQNHIPEEGLVLLFQRSA